MKSRVMYIELKTDGLRGTARIGRVAFSQTGKTLYYAGRTLAPLHGRALKANHVDTLTLEEFWLSGPRVDGGDSLFPMTIDIDEDVREEYWRDVRREPKSIELPSYKSPGKSVRSRDLQEAGVRRRDMDRRSTAPRVETEPDSLTSLAVSDDD